LFGEADLDGLALQLRLAEAAAEQLRRNADILLADPDVALATGAVHDAGFGEYLAWQQRQAKEEEK
jgi:hypothetical protein